MERPQDIGKEFEVYWSKQVDGRKVSGSGSKWYSRMDIRDKIFLWSLKATAKRSFTITQGMIDEIVNATTKPGESRSVPALAIRVGKPEYDLVVLLANDFISLMKDEARYIPPTKTEVKRLQAQKPILFRD